MRRSTVGFSFIVALAACGGSASPAAPPGSLPVAGTAPPGGIGLGNGPGGAPGTPAPDATNGSPRGRLAPEVIQRVVREDFAAMRRCYEAGLGRDPSLTGKIATKLVIGSDGTVTHTEIVANRKFDSGDADYPPFPDSVVTECVAARFAALRFPKPEGEGIVVVVYPIVFKPTD